MYIFSYKIINIRQRAYLYRLNMIDVFKNIREDFIFNDIDYIFSI